MDKKLLRSMLALFLVLCCVTSIALITNKKFHILGILKADKITVGVVKDNPPFTFNENGKLEGFDIDLINKLANRLHKTAHFVPLTQNELSKHLKEGKVQIGIGGLSLHLMVTKKDTLDIVQYEAPLQNLQCIIHKASKTINLSPDSNRVYNFGVVQDSLEEFHLQTYINTNGLSSKVIIKTQESQKELIEALNDSFLDGAFLSIGQYKLLNKEYAGMFVCDEISNGDESKNIFFRRYAIIMDNGSSLYKPISKAITLIGEDGTIDSIKLKWIGYNYSTLSHSSSLLQML